MERKITLESIRKNRKKILIITGATVLTFGAGMLTVVLGKKVKDFRLRSEITKHLNDSSIRYIDRHPEMYDKIMDAMEDYCLSADHIWSECPDTLDMILGGMKANKLGEIGMKLIEAGIARPDEDICTVLTITKKD